MATNESGQQEARDRAYTVCLTHDY